ncbi:MAG: pantoate--beta-alanine ligase [Halobacillus sp.]|uniref:Pantothenate synthetase n=1 Tax=Halobacillus halophilus (strain ATCC 35676 / DSM 2266 / JCM 20832 / KCTC 3685 / LMG 17431 / NBRC 102448 / NCIMB 2269) TaxID=866895 RepID=I0JN81_HALH3|nr:pantoate--beta-alanine ligase [Halobacillus halophilus]ASF39664.1 pantoate--beta-alanine ligase [Halobacillus halophilus]CCG45601.1 pantoate-beta-alanine ligase [Halobacillus halophilus DSM 2266]
MKVIKEIKEMQKTTADLTRAGKSIGFVPTMGYLHEGHERLLQEARKENDYVILSIYVNPLQFGEHEDLDHYPRNIDHDLSVAKRNDIDFIFLPENKTMYPAPLSIEMTVSKRAHVLCGRSRPGHFEGVVTILTKLFNICRPTKAYFGQKDAQQVAVVDALIQDFNFPVQLVSVPTVREDDGLAKSSRNINLSPQERSEAPAIQKALQKGRSRLMQTRNPDIQEAIQETRQFLERETRGKIDYIELLSYPELEPIETFDRQVILAAAVYYENARLIDNTVFHPGDIS